MFAESELCRLPVDGLRAIEERPNSPGPAPSGAAGDPPEESEVGDPLFPRHGIGILRLGG